MSFHVNVIPAAWAMATRCMVWLVEPPVASSATHAVDDRAFVDHLADGCVVVAQGGQRGDLATGLGGQCGAQRGAGIDEARPGQVQAHHFHQQLIGVGGAEERAGSAAVIRRGLGVEQLLDRPTLFSA